jgi:hypothetical protein
MNYKDEPDAIPGRVVDAGQLAAQILTCPIVSGERISGRALFLTPGNATPHLVPNDGDTYFGIASSPDAQPQQTDKLCSIIAKGKVWAVAAEEVEAFSKVGFNEEGKIVNLANSAFSLDADLFVQGDSVYLGETILVPLFTIPAIITTKGGSNDE